MARRSVGLVLPVADHFIDHYPTTSPPHHLTTPPPHHPTTSPPHHLITLLHSSFLCPRGPIRKVTGASWGPEPAHLQEKGPLMVRAAGLILAAALLALVGFVPAADDKPRGDQD